MPKIPYKTDKARDDGEDYEIVSFEDFCDKSPGSKTNLLTLNDNINYQLRYEVDRLSKALENEGPSSSKGEIETSLNDPKNASFKTKGSSSFAPFGRYNARTGKGMLFSGVIPKPKSEAGTTPPREHRYQRFSEERNFLRRIRNRMPTLGSGIMGIVVVLALCFAGWWLVCGMLGGAWGEEHYKKLWERAHPDSIKKPLMPVQIEKIIPQVIPEHRYHDHNNLSTKNKNATEVKKTDLRQPLGFRDEEMMKELCAAQPDDMKFDCLPTNTPNESECIKRACCWRPTSVKGAPYCYYPPQYDTYRFVNMSENKHGTIATYATLRPSLYPEDFEIVNMEVKYLSNNVVQVKFYNAQKKRFEPPYPDIPTVAKSISEMTYRVQVDSGKLGFKVIRLIDNITVVNTQDVGGLILADKFLQISTLLPTEHVFGIGERQGRFRLDLNWVTYTLFNSDQVPVEGLPLYGTHPFYLAVEEDGSSHGMLLLNSNAIDVVAQPTPALTYRALGGILNFFIFMGPSPADVISQYTELIGRPFLPPYWALGFHLCKFDYGSLNATEKVWRANREAGIPFDAQWNDIDYMDDHNDFTYDKVTYGGLPHFVEEVHEAGMKYVIILDPGVAYLQQPGEYPPFERGMEMNVFIRNTSDHPFVGKVWNRALTVWPDFTHPNSTSYWLEMLTDFHQKIQFDGLWIDMNEPSNFISGEYHAACNSEYLPYKPRHISEDGLRTKTLCMNARHHLSEHYNVHNLYSLTESVATDFAMKEIRGKRSMIISRSTFVGSGHYVGHWTGDVRSAWHDMRMTIPAILSSSIFGIPLVGADICGFNGNTTVELCNRWTQLGAFYPFARNHNTNTANPQDPASLGPRAVAVARAALRMRYSLLPYYYTAFYRAHLFGHTVARPLFFEFPSRPDIFGIDTQFLIGPHLMITPIMDKGATTVKAFFPGPSGWYSLQGYELIAADKWALVNSTQTVSIRGGAIIPMQALTGGASSTARARSGPMQLLAAPDTRGRAQGELYWDDGESLNTFEEKKYSQIKFLLRSDKLTCNVVWWGYGVPILNKVTILNQTAVSSVYLNGKTCEKPQCNFLYSKKKRSLDVSFLQISMDKLFTLKWNMYEDD